LNSEANNFKIGFADVAQNGLYLGGENAVRTDYWNGQIENLKSGLIYSAGNCEKPIFLWATVRLIPADFYSGAYKITDNSNVLTLACRKQG